ncbi:MAG: hypothetical protein KGD60_06625 [Candidatus Thorarchaeota archaeon]|nr:hypothetical protein [Candidatus Thorarchaeota archaeon]
MVEETSDIHVIVYTSYGETHRGKMRYWKEGPEVVLDNGTHIRDGTNLKFQFQKEFLKDHPSLDLGESHLVEFSPIHVSEMGYSRIPIGKDTMYPPSSKNWFPHVIEGDPVSIFTIQPLMNDKRFLLTISNLHGGGFVNAFLIHNYELALLSMKRDWMVYRDIFYNKMATPEIEDLLDSEPPSWSFISSLVEDVTIPNLTIKKTMKDTLEQLVPSSFPPHIRSQVMAFLAWLNVSTIPNEDPVDFKTKYSSAELFGILVNGHLMCQLDEVEPPPYVRIMMMADRGQLKLTERPPPETELQNPWYQARLKIEEMVPDMMKRVIDHAQTLNAQGIITTKLPITRSEAINSKSAWSNRFALTILGLFMRGHVQRKSLGLKTAIYFGAAHKWPHKHLEISARLGFQSNKPPQVQIMVLPSSSIERVTRILPTVHIIDWEMGSLNLSLYNSSRRRWSINSSTIFKSLERSRSLRQLTREFGGWRNRTPIVMDQERAKILDLISWGLYLASLEKEQYSDYFHIDNRTIEDTLKQLKNEGVFSLQYSLVLHKLTSICILAEGPSSPIYSLARSFLKHAPSADVRINEDGTTCLIIARVPEDKAYDLLTRLPLKASESGITLRALPISAYIGYRNNLYQRLLKNDGTWDDDISGLLSQIRLQSKNED